jgi:hypothetical protein
VVRLSLGCFALLAMTESAVENRADGSKSPASGRLRPNLRIVNGSTAL